MKKTDQTNSQSQQKAPKKVDHDRSNGADRPLMNDELLSADATLLQRSLGNQAVRSLANGGGSDRSALHSELDFSEILDRDVGSNEKSSDEKSTETSGSSGMIQRIMTLDQFKEKTSLSIVQPRNKVVAVDTALTRYRGLKSDVDGVVGKHAAANELIAACDTYIDADKAKRKPGVRLLRQEAVDEASVLAKLAASQGKGLAETFELVTEAQDLALKLKGEGRVPLGLVNFDAWLMPLINAVSRDDEAREQVMAGQVAKLDAIRNNAETDPLLKNILTEILANYESGKASVVPAVGSPMAKMNDNSDRDQGYEVHHFMNTPLGSAERLGSLTHELTHVSVGEKFKNSGLFLAFKREATDDEILGLSRKRTQQCQELLALAEASDHFDGDQKNLLFSKIKYPYDGYKGDITRYIKPVNIDPESELAERIRNLAAQGLNNTVIEFDTVINQMMMYMNQWKVPNDNEFYVKLKAVAQEAYNHRNG
ncbi:MAG: hypothetical protein AAF633_00365 [Chloroflexota bacterium]